MEVTIRPAISEDCSRIMQLIHELAVYERAPDAVTVDFDHFTESGFGKNPVWYALVAEYNGKVEGFALYYIRYSTWKGQCMYLEDFLVAEEMRGHGIGKMLFDKLFALCTEKGYYSMVWQVLDWNEPAIRFYKKFDGVIIDNSWLNCSMVVQKKK